MTGLKYKGKSELLGAIENLVKLRSAIDRNYEPWFKALILIKEMKVDEAALLASKSCDQNFMNDPIKKLILDEISNLAVLNNIEGPGIECMWSTAADLGYMDLAYNAGNQILWRKSNKSADDYKLASRYFQMAIRGSSNESIRYSAQTNYAEIIREGLVTGHKDWLGAIALYEEAGEKGLINAMFNAGNVLLWLVEAGDRTYSSRAKAWFERIISHVASGRDSLDLGGREEVIQRLKSARVRLAGMHLDGLLDSPCLLTAKDLLADYPDDDRVSCMLKRISSTQLIRSCSSLSKGEHNPWVDFLRASGWTVIAEPVVVKLPPEVDPGVQMLQIETNGGYQMTALSFDYFTHPDVDPDEEYQTAAKLMSDKFHKPIFFVGKKGFFLQFKNMMFDAIQVVVDGNVELVPIWPGASSDQVYETLSESIGSRFVSGRDDPMNTIPRIINAIDEGFSISGDELPNAIWLAVSDVLAMPIHRPDEPARIGLYVTQCIEDLRRALQAHNSGDL